jgi:hypothetical protein
MFYIEVDRRDLFYLVNLVAFHPEYRFVLVSNQNIQEEISISYKFQNGLLIIFMIENSV